MKRNKKNIVDEPEVLEEIEELDLPELRPVKESSKTELLWLLGELNRLGIRSISDLENLVARAE